MSVGAWEELGAWDTLLDRAEEDAALDLEADELVTGEGVNSFLLARPASEDAGVVGKDASKVGVEFDCSGGVAGEGKVLVDNAGEVLVLGEDDGAVVGLGMGVSNGV